MYWSTQIQLAFIHDSDIILNYHLCYTATGPKANGGDSFWWLGSRNEESWTSYSHHFTISVSFSPHQSLQALFLFSFWPQENSSQMWFSFLHQSHCSYSFLFFLWFVGVFFSSKIVGALCCALKTASMDWSKLYWIFWIWGNINICNLTHTLLVFHFDILKVNF